jgi:hypothetical protein
LVILPKRRFSRKDERGTTVVVVVMVTTLITAIGIFAVRNVSQIDQAVGYSRQSGQTNALAELGTTAAVTQVGSMGSYYSDQMSMGLKCLANGPYATASSSSCFHLNQGDFDTVTTGHSGETLLEPSAAGETGSFGPLANTAGLVRVEMTEKHATNTPIPGSSGTAFDVTLTTTASVSPIVAGSDPCGGGVATMAVKKVMRAHVILPPN